MYVEFTETKKQQTNPFDWRTNRMKTFIEAHFFIERYDYFLFAKANFAIKCFELYTNAFKLYLETFMLVQWCLLIMQTTFVRWQIEHAVKVCWLRPHYSDRVIKVHVKIKVSEFSINYYVIRNHLAERLNFHRGV